MPNDIANNMADTIHQLEKELKELREENINIKNDNERLRDCVDSCVLNGELDYAELAEAKRLLKAAVEDFAKLDRENAKNKNCMMPEMDCADCPLSWDSVDDRVEPCHSWRYAAEALALIGEDGDTND